MVRGLYLVAAAVALYPVAYLVYLAIQPTGPEAGGLLVANVLYTMIVRAPLALVVAAACAGTAYILSSDYGEER